MRVLLLFCFLISLSLEGQEHFTPLGRDQLVADLSELIENKPDNALAVIEQWMLSYQHHKLVTHEDLCKVYKAQALIELDSTEKAIQLLNSLLNKSDPYTEALALKILASIDFKNGRFFSSTTKIRSAMELAKSNHEEELMAELQEDLALVFDKISKPDKAIHFYRRSLLLFTKLNKSSAMQKNALALGRIYLDLERLDSAMFFINQSLELAQLKKNIPAIYESKIELANFYYTNKNYTELNTIIQEIEQAKDTPKEDFFKVRLHVLKGNYAMAVSSEEKALEEFNKAEALSHQGFTPFIDYYIKSNLAEAYYRNGNVQKAYELIKYLNHNSTSYSSKENSKLAEAIESNSEVHIRDREIDYLKIQNQLKEERIRRELLFQAGLKRENQLKDYTLKQEHQLHEAAVREQALQSQQLQQERVMSQALVRENDLRKATLVDEQNFQTVLWFGIILLMGLSLLVFFLLRKQQEKNAIIIKQTNDLEFINKEVHHRVKNNLQVISSLLDLQSKYAQDNGYQNLLMESKHRVQSMAFIHQNLYASAGLNMVDMPNYVLNLVDHLVTAYQKEGEKVNIQVEVDPIQLHMDTVVSIGMIINELVTNALKYAFYNLGGGTIQVSLKEVDEKIHLGIKDDGVGIPEGIDIAGSSSFGYKMVRAFVQKLKGKLDLNRIQGTQIQIQFSKK
ncbi:MAG: sensor histidine kinase [Saprospiraceae bacterium]|nr:sensor histidine kinase [Candidatus Vicinibacter affinis]